jgi:hypothetical protein
MAYFLVTYDLVKRKDYPELLSALRKLNGTHKPLDSVWFLDLNNTAEEVKAHLAVHIDADDRLMVVEFSKRPAWTKAYTGTNDWVKARFG